jgi:hypothetical protein
LLYCQRPLGADPLFENRSPLYISVSMTHKADSADGGATRLEALADQSGDTPYLLLLDGRERPYTVLVPWKTAHGLA